MTWVIDKSESTNSVNQIFKSRKKMDSRNYFRGMSNTTPDCQCDEDTSLIYKKCGTINHRFFIHPSRY